MWWLVPNGVKGAMGGGGGKNWDVVWEIFSKESNDPSSGPFLKLGIRNRT